MPPPKPPETPAALPLALNRDFFARNTLVVARELLGCYLICKPPGSKRKLAFKITETEAYTEEDPACHAFGKGGGKPCQASGKKGGRAATLFKAPGLSYVYLIYGMHHCLNVVTEAEGTGAAVLFRAVEPPGEFHGVSNGHFLNTRGPGRLCKALGITRQTHNELVMTSPKSPLYIAEGPRPKRSQITRTTRIGITKAADYPWRFYLNESRFVSVR